MPSVTIGELRKLLLELARHAEEGAGCMYSEGYSDDENEALHARECANRAREVEAELQVLDCAAFLMAILVKVEADAPL